MKADPDRGVSEYFTPQGFCVFCPQVWARKAARALKLGCYSLKERIDAGNGQGSRQMSGRPEFVKLVPLPAAAVSEYTRELEDPSGARMRIHLKGAAVPDLTDLSESLGGWADDSGLSRERILVTVNPADYRCGIASMA